MVNSHPSKSSLFVPLGVVSTQTRTILVSYEPQSPNILNLETSLNPYNFQHLETSLTLVANQSENFQRVQHVSYKNESYFMFSSLVSGKTFLELGTLNGNREINRKPIPLPQENAAIVSDFKHHTNFVMYHGDRAIRLSYSGNLIDWETQSDPLLIESSPLEVGDVFKTADGILLLFFKKKIVSGLTLRSAHLALFSAANPEKLLWRTKEPLWEQSNLWAKQEATYLGTIMHKGQLVSYWRLEGKIIYAVILSGFKYDPRHILVNKKLKLSKHENNPILAPAPENDWEAFNTFNPAAIAVGDKVHILYRAQGFDYISSFGYAVSNDGKLIDARLKTPAYSARMNFENNQTGKVDPSLVSGGGFGGCEDPRLTLLDDRVYMTYVAFDGWSPPRLALTSILLDDFLNQRWNWTKPVLVSPPGVVDKSGCLLPEKINGKFVFFHRIFPNILIDFVSDLNFDGKSVWLKGEHQIKVRENMWDSRKIGAGAPPLKTKDGWLLIYYGVDDKDASKYHIGAMLLDLKDPTKVLFRSNAPILEPSEDYEMNGFKPGIAYPCGAVIVKSELLVYYGGADSVVCVAVADLNTFLDELKSQKTPKITTIMIREVMS